MCIVHAEVVRASAPRLPSIGVADGTASTTVTINGHGVGSAQAKSGDELRCCANGLHLSMNSDGAFAAGVGMSTSSRSGSSQGIMASSACEVCTAKQILFSMYAAIEFIKHTMVPWVRVAEWAQGTVSATRRQENKQAKHHGPAQVT
jgi:hypothetical protein